tara:strand:- start:868 stop:984 length:117 start_codon:yes stop_codon:yes gene_type:complete
MATGTFIGAAVIYTMTPKYDKLKIKAMNKDKKKNLALA